MQLSRRGVMVAPILLIMVIGWWFWPRSPQGTPASSARLPDKIAAGGATHQPTGPGSAGGDGWLKTHPGQAAGSVPPPPGSAQVAYIPAAPVAPSSSSGPSNWAPGGSHPINPALAPPTQPAPWKNKSGVAKPIRLRKVEDRKKHVAAEARQKRLDHLKSMMSGKRLLDFEKRAELLAKLKEKKKQ